mmetsp:Transcript_12205/g.22630  ORF Transcript_12205/g.22630 Transcript_12205/m.22630 type:complete len:226 (-) Transcript_12205:112-789(-)|eukprot:CAMPEP_0184541420 /NCGR_PEP_ID=MMETSP0199_2-20130426/1356_1 /TAXON_ID=1112570 /ORGANISM="Thraustochytrium sp., Strain LLF1b" /LENGTH=225 /DNA_ID=CAMNT_0026935137 /DNA_START=66 /DNA_END=743 /DNA_ORIENTATION=+
MGRGGGGGGGGPGAKAKAQKLEAQRAKEQEAHAKKLAQKDKQWEDGANTRAIQKQKEKEEKEAARLAAAAAKKAVEEQDAAEIANMKAPVGKARTNQKKKKKNKNDLSLLDAYLADKDKAAKKKEKNNDLLKPNLNRERAAQAAEGHVDASGLDNALAALGVDDEKTEKGPGRKALHLAFEERRMAELKEEYPGLKRSQLKDKIWKEWLKYPGNPDNQPKEGVAA